MEADLARYYPRDRDQIHAFYDGRMTLRRMYVLVRGLPYDSAVQSVIRAAEKKAEAAKQVADVEDTLAPFQR